MKKIFTLAAAILAINTLSIQAQSMKVTKTDGTIYEFLTEDVKSIVFLEGDGGIAENGFEFVDLGLPSGTMWAKCNVGANAPEEAGDYFAWGEVLTKDNYTSQTYVYGSADSADENGYDRLTAISKYNTFSAYGEVDGKTQLEPEDDAATANMGGAWRMPTYDDLNELLTSCYCQVTKINDVRGLKFIGPNGNSIFLPSVGLRYGDIVMFNDVAMKFGFYWTSTLAEDDPQMAHYMYSEGGQNKHGESFRFYGQSVRAVFKK